MALTIGTIARFDIDTRFHLFKASGKHAMFIGNLSTPTKLDTIIIMNEWWLTESVNTKWTQRRTSTEKAVPINPENNANIKYNVPISFALDDQNHLSVQRDIPELFLNILLSFSST